MLLCYLWLSRGTVEKSQGTNQHLLMSVPVTRSQTFQASCPQLYPIGAIIPQNRTARCQTWSLHSQRTARSYRVTLWAYQRTPWGHRPGCQFPNPPLVDQNCCRTLPPLVYRNYCQVTLLPLVDRNYCQASLPQVCQSCYQTLLI